MWRSPGAALQKVDRDAFRRGRTRVLQRLRGELAEVIRDNGMRRASRAERLAWERSRRGQPALSLKRAFESKRDFFVQFLKCFGIFYLLQ